MRNVNADAPCESAIMGLVFGNGSCFLGMGLSFYAKCLNTSGRGLECNDILFVDETYANVFARVMS